MSRRDVLSDHCDDSSNVIANNNLINDMSEARTEKRQQVVISIEKGKTNFDVNIDLREL